MIRLRAPAAALLATLALGCDALEYPPIVEPMPGPPAAGIHVRYEQQDSLRGRLDVVLAAWPLPPDAQSVVSLDGHPVPRLEAFEDESRFGHSWTLEAGGVADLPQAVAISGPGNGTLRFDLPVLIREGTGVVCVGEADPLLPYSGIAAPTDSIRGWALDIGAGAQRVVIHGTGPPPDPLAVPRALLGALDQPGSAIFSADLYSMAAIAEATVRLSARLAVRWTLVAAGAGHPACPG